MKKWMFVLTSILIINSTQAEIYNGSSNIANNHMDNFTILSCDSLKVFDPTIMSGLKVKNYTEVKDFLDAKHNQFQNLAVCCK